MHVGDTVLVGSAKTPITVTGLGLRHRLPAAGRVLRAARHLAPGPGRLPARTPTCRPTRSRRSWWSSTAGPTSAAVAAAIDAATGGATSTLTEVRGGAGAARHQGAELHLLGDHLRHVVRGRPRGRALLRPAHPRAHRPLLGAQGHRRLAAARSSAASCIQAVLVALVSFVIGGRAHAGGSPSCSPPRSRVGLVPARAVQIAVGLVVMSALGAAVSLRRVVRVDPASAIG